MTWDYEDGDIAHDEDWIEITWRSHDKSKKKILLSDGEVKEAISIIESGRFDRSFKANRDHVKHVKDIVQKKQDEKICPKCGSAMILRTVKKGANAGNQLSWPGGRGQHRKSFPRLKRLQNHAPEPDLWPDLPFCM
jgi:hypothetical protein